MDTARGKLEQAARDTPGTRPGGLDLTERRGRYGFDAPYVPMMLGGAGLLLLLMAGISGARRHRLWMAAMLGAGGWMMLSTGSYVYATRRGKFAVWADLLRQLRLRGDERLLDMGCGRGAVLMMAAKLLPRGQAVGLDLWKSTDQSGNTMGAARRNAEREMVLERVELQTGDISAMPFESESFDVVLSSLAIHNIGDAAGRRKAVDEAVRVLKPGCRLLIADFRSTEEYEERLRQLRMERVRHQMLDWRYWYGGPWTATRLVTATKPSSL